MYKVWGQGVYMTRRFYELHGPDSDFAPMVCSTLIPQSYLSLEYILQRRAILFNLYNRRDDGCAVRPDGKHLQRYLVGAAEHCRSQHLGGAAVSLQAAIQQQRYLVGVA